MVDLANSTIELLKRFEGCKLNAYTLEGVVHIGYGFTYYQSGWLKNKFGRANIRMGDSITQAEADAELEMMLNDYADYVNSQVKVQLNQNQFDALVSLCFNIGKGAFKGSTLLRLLNQGDYSGAADEFSKWRISNGVVNPVLVARRAEERALFGGSGSSTTNYIFLAIVAFVVVKMLKKN